MARSVEGPWYRASKGTWYATMAGKKVSLGVRGEGNKADAVKAWHRLMAGVTNRPAVASTSPGGEKGAPADTPVAPTATPTVPVRPAATAVLTAATVVTVRQMVDTYLTDAESRVSPGAYRGYRKFLRPLADHCPERPAASLTAADVTAFLARQPTWGSTYRAGFHGTASQMFRWAVEAGHVARNPMDGVKKPAKRSRGANAVLTADEHARLIQAAEPDTRDLLAVLWGTGARPSEVAGLTAEMVRQAPDGVIALADHKTAHKGKSRHLILTGEALAVVRRRADVAGEGLLWEGLNGKLTATAIGCKLRRLCRKAGVRHLIPYGYRYTFATDALANGVPDATVASLLGHCDTSMIHKHYSHLSARTRALKDAAARVRPGDDGAAA